MISPLIPLLLGWLTVTGSSIRILSIGDSVDRYALHDWCMSKHGMFCKVVNENGWIWKPTNCSTLSSSPIRLFDMFKFSVRVYSWSVSVCDAPQHNITLGFLFNMQGASPNGPWYDPRKSQLGLEKYAKGSMNSMAETFRIAQGPAITPLVSAMGGSPDAVIVNTCFWDIGRLVTGPMGRHGGVETCSSPILRTQWVKSWANNASELVDAIREYFPRTWMAWRSANDILTPDPPCRQEMILEMNSAARNISSRKQLDWIEFHKFLGVNKNRRDSVHPGPEFNTIYIDSVIRRVKNVLPF